MNTPPWLWGSAHCAYPCPDSGPLPQNRGTLPVIIGSRMDSLCQGVISPLVGNRRTTVSPKPFLAWALLLPDEEWVFTRPRWANGAENLAVPYGKFPAPHIHVYSCPIITSSPASNLTHRFGVSVFRTNLPAESGLVRCRHFCRCPAQSFLRLLGCFP